VTTAKCLVAGHGAHDAAGDQHQPEQAHQRRRIDVLEEGCGQQGGEQAELHREPSLAASTSTPSHLTTSRARWTAQVRMHRHDAPSERPRADQAAGRFKPDTMTHRTQGDSAVALPSRHSPDCGTGLDAALHCIKDLVDVIFDLSRLSGRPASTPRRLQRTVTGMRCTTLLPMPW
jgi:hypothetical protein